MAKQVSKVLIKDSASGKYLLLIRFDHPEFANDPDLPGGGHEDGEGITDTAVREVQEETGIDISGSKLVQLYNGDGYSTHKTIYTLFYTELSKRPEVILSWEHGSFEWVSAEEIIAKGRDAKDSFMHMVADSFEKFIKV